MNDYLKEEVVISSQKGLLRKLANNQKYRDMNLKIGDRAIVTIKVIQRFDDYEER